LNRSDATPLELRSDPSALAPESLIVFELKTPLVTFAAAVSAIPGLEFVGEDDEQIEDEDGSEIPGHYYAVFTNQVALKRLLSLWDRWRANKPLDEYKAWQKVFACLHDLRRWGAKDRVTEGHAEVIRRLANSIARNETIHLEVELVFRSDTAAADAARARIREELRSADVTELAAARYEGFAFDALLIEVSTEAALAVADRMQDGLAGLNDAFRIRPQSVGYGFAGDDRDNAPSIQLPESIGDPIIAIFDGVPIANHPYLAGRIILDDPDNLAALAVGPRVHGTAMASLVIHGDLLRDSTVPRRPIYARPFLIDTDNFPGVFNERSISNRLLIDDIVRAVLRLKRQVGSDPAVAPNVIVINISFAIPDLVFDETISPLARCLDWLSWNYGVLFVVSAGNCLDPLETNFATADDLNRASPAERTGSTLAALRNVQRHQRILSPAESMNSLTVGALHDDSLGTASIVGQSYDPFPEALVPSVYSRMGLGLARSTKPDFLAPGGRLRVQLQPGKTPIGYMRVSRPSRLGGLRVAGQIDAVSGPQLSWSGATSGAAAMTTHALHLVNDALEDAYGDRYSRLVDPFKALLLKVLILHRAKWPTASEELVEKVFGQGQDRHFSAKRADMARLFGFGILDQDESVTCAFSRATAWAVGKVENDKGQIFRMPMPECLNGQRVTKALSATVCWFAPIKPGRQTYRGAKLRIDEKEDRFGEDLKSLGAKVSHHQLDSVAARRGTIAHRRWEGAAAANLQENLEFQFKISRIKDESGVDEIPFALAVTIEAEGNLPIYDQVLNHIDVALRPRIPTAVVA
jgi:hypothetical protein